MRKVFGNFSCGMSVSAMQNRQLVLFPIEPTMLLPILFTKADQLTEAKVHILHIELMCTERCIRAYILDILRFSISHFAPEIVVNNRAEIEVSNTRDDFIHTQTAFPYFVVSIMFSILFLLLFFRVMSQCTKSPDHTFSSISLPDVHAMMRTTNPFKWAQRSMTIQQWLTEKKTVPTKA